MMKLKFSRVEIVTQEKRLDLSIDYLLKLTSSESVYYTPIRLSKVLATSLYRDKKTNSEKYVSIERKRTIDASIKSLVKQYPAILSNDSSLFYSLHSDDQAERRRIVLSKRKWKIHHVARWRNGFFIARLSCTRSTELGHQSTQYILYPSQLQSLVNPKPLQEWDCYTSHGSFSASYAVNARTLLNALVYEEEWPSLSKTLYHLEHGYNTEQEAIAGFQYILGKQETPPYRIIRSNRQNSIKQKSVDTTIEIDFIDSYNNHREKAWLLEANGYYYIMRMDSMTPNKVALANSSVSTSFTNAQESAQVLLTLCYAEKYDAKCSKEEAIKLWKEMIERDVYHRYFSDNIRATWLITKIATNDGVVVALLAECYAESNLLIPEYFSPLAHRVLLVEKNNLVDPSRRNGKLFQGKIDKSKFENACQELIKLSNDVNGDNFAIHHKELEDILIYTQGFTCIEQATQIFEDIQSEHIHDIEGGACSIKAKLKSARYEYLQGVHRSKLVLRLKDNRLPESKLIDYDRHIETSRTYPEQLLEYGMSCDLLTLDDAGNINTYVREYRGVNAIDVIPDIDGLDVTRMTTQIKQSVVEYVEKPKVIIKSIQKSNAGRKKIYINEQERKKVWARNNRLKVKEEAKLKGESPKLRGRERIYVNAAEKEREYRFRKKWRKIALDGFLVVILPDIIKSKHLELFENIKKILPYFGKRILIVTHNQSSSKNTIEKLLSNSAVNIDIVDSKETRLSAYRCLLNAGFVKGIVHICGCGVEQQGYSIAMSLFNRDVSFKFQKSLLISDDIEAVQKVFKLAFSQNTMQK
jgi:hypothetical protein